MSCGARAVAYRDAMLCRTRRFVRLLLVAVARAAPEALGSDSGDASEARSQLLAEARKRATTLRAWSRSDFRG
jgi:hypothetical protein